MHQYFQLLLENKLEEAERLRKECVPNKLTKFIPLSDDNNKNKSIFDVLESNRLWFSDIKFFNDPYEGKWMYVDKQELSKFKYQEENFIEMQNFLKERTDQFVVSCLSKNTFNCLPMWAYYTNNYKGFCVEYSVERADAIYPVEYVSDRMDIGKILSILCWEVQEYKNNPNNAKSNNIKSKATLLNLQFQIKHQSWSHENEYRILYPNYLYTTGIAASLKQIGLKVNKIVAGINCTDEHLNRLSEISMSLGSGNVSRIKLSKSKYDLLY